MIVKISAIEREFRNTHPGIKKMFEWIDESMMELHAELSHLIVDGVEVVDEPLTHIKKKLKHIERIEVSFRVKTPARRRKKSAITVSGAQKDIMRVRISNIEFTVDKTPAGLDELFSRIDDAMNEFQVYFSHLKVDGEDLSDSSRENLTAQMDKIQDVEVIFQTAEQYLMQVVRIMEHFIEQSVPVMKLVANDFYGHYDNDTWERFNLIVTIFTEIVQTIRGLVSNSDFRGKVDIFGKLGEDIVKELTALNEAIVGNDMILAADLLLYELKPFVENLHTALQELSRSERHDIH